MPKRMYVDPVSMREPGVIEFTPILKNQYQKTVKEEKKRFSREEFVNIYRDMLLIREFELMLQAIKKLGTYAGRSFTYPGPAHLSLGEEAVAVGQSFWLDKDDCIIGNHRSHHEMIAKAMSTIRKMNEEELLQIMKTFANGRLLRSVEGLNENSVKELAENFFLYGAVCELFAKENGFNGGLGGSMHAFFLPFGIYPNNAIVGGSAPIAAGIALFKKCNRKKGIVVANAGDGSVGCGPVWEALNFSSMDQYRHLWEEEYRGGLPVIFNFTNNSYGMGGQTCGETMAYRQLARIGAGIDGTNQLHAERIDGFNPLAVIDAYQRKKEIAEKGDGPCLLDIVSYRFSGHSPSDVSSYRTEEEIEAWRKYDPLTQYPIQLVDAGILTGTQLEQLQSEAREKIRQVFLRATDSEFSPLVDYQARPNYIADMIFSNGRKEKMEERPCEVRTSLEENIRIKKLREVSKRYAFDKDGKPYSKAKVYNVRDGIFEAVLTKFYQDPTLIAYGQDVRDWGGPFAVYRNMTDSLPYHRYFNSPISEAAMVGAAVGYGMAGGRVIVELMYSDFMGRAGDELFNQLAKWQAMSAGGLKMPVVIRISVGTRYGAQHSQDWSSLATHIPGLKVVFPVTPYDAKGIMNQALSGTDPVLFFESQRTYDQGERFHHGGVPLEYYEIPIGKPDIKRVGTDLTILTVGAPLYRAMDAADILQEKYGVNAEIIDARGLVPFDYEILLDSVRKTGRLLLVSDAVTRGSFLNDIAVNITRMAFDYLDAPPVVVGTKNWISPAYEHDQEYFPQTEWILDAIHQQILPLSGHKCMVSYEDEQFIENSKKGV